jgi:hypothetical protein
MEKANEIWVSDFNLNALQAEGEAAELIDRAYAVAWEASEVVSRGQ